MLLGAAKHTFVEKPLATSSTEARQLVNLAARRKVLLATGYIFLYHPVYLYLKSLISCVTIKRLVFEWKKYGTFTEPIELNLLTHHIALALDLLGEPLRGTIRYGPGIQSDCDAIETHLYYDQHEVVSIIDRSCLKETRHTLIVELYDGSSLMWEGNQLFAATSSNSIPAAIYEATAQPLQIELSMFIDATKHTGVSLSTGGDFGMRVLRVHEMIEEII
jgi:predicted dehydrogenase